MAEESVKLKFEADIADFKKKVAEMPDVTKTEAAKMVREYSTGLKKLNKANDDSFKNSEKGLKKLAQAMGFGDRAEKLGNLSEGIKAIGPAGIAAAGGVALLGAELLVLKGAIDLAYQLATAIDSAARNADKLAPKLAAISGTPIISPESLAAANAYESQMGALDVVTAGFTAVLVDEYAPAMERAAAITTTVGLRVLDAYKSFQTLTDSIRAFNMTIPTAIADAIGLTDAVNGLAGEGEAARIKAESYERSIAAQGKAHAETKPKTEAHTKAIKDHASAADDAAEASRKLHEEWAKSDAAFEAEKIDEAGQAIMAYAESWNSAARALIAVNAAHNDAVIAERIQAEQDAADKALKIAEDGTALRKEMNQELYNEAMALGSQLADQAQAHHEDEVARLNDLIANKQAAMKQAIKNGNIERADRLKGEIATDKAKRDLEIKQAKRAHAASKAIAIMGIAVSTAQATMALLASPAIAIAAYGAPAIAAGIAIGTGALQAAAVAAAPAPKFHTGKAAPDEKTATVLDSESVLTGRATQALGGAKGVNALNAGAKPGGSVTVLLAIGKRQAEQIVQDGAGALSMTKADPFGAGRYGGR